MPDRQRRTLLVRIGSNWFWRFILAPFQYFLVSRFTSREQPRHIVTFSKTEPTQAPLSNTQYAPLSEDTLLKVYVLGHGGTNQSILGAVDGSFQLSSAEVAQRLDALLKSMQLQPNTTPITISLLSCDAASQNEKAFAVSLMRDLFRLGHRHVLVKAREGKIFPFFLGRKMAFGQKHHYTIEGDHILSVRGDHDLMYIIEKTLRNCRDQTPDQEKRAYLSTVLTQLHHLKSNTPSFENVKDLVHTLAQAQVTHVTHGWTRFFNGHSRTTTQVNRLLGRLTSQHSLRTTERIYQLN